MSDLPDLSGFPAFEETRAEFEAWLTKWPGEIGVLLAARMALRIMPFSTIVYRDSSHYAVYERHTEAIFRAIASAWCASLYSAQVADLGERARAASQRVSDAVSAVRLYTPDLRNTTPAEDQLPQTAKAAALAASVAMDAVPRQVISAIGRGISGDPEESGIYADLRWIVKEKRSPSQMAAAPLWLDGEPSWFAKYRTELTRLLDSVPHWRVWRDWYDSRVDGYARADQIELVYARTPQNLWSDPEKENEWIAVEIEKIQTSTSSKRPIPEDFTSKPPELPNPEPGLRVIVRDDKIDIDLHRSSNYPPFDKRSSALLSELREAARDFANSFDAHTNAHSQLRNALKRYRDQIDLNDPDVNVIFALGLRLENALSASSRAMSNRFEPELEDTQQEALLSVMRIHAVFIASDPEGVELLQAAERYAYKPSDDEQFKERVEPIIEGLSRNALATEQLIEALNGVIEEMNEGEHPARSGVIGRGSVQRALLFLAGAAINGVVSATSGQIFIHSSVGQQVIQAGAPLADKAIGFFREYAHPLRDLAAVGNEGLAFLGRVIDSIGIKLGW